MIGASVVRVAAMWGGAGSAGGVAGVAWAKTRAGATAGASDTDGGHCITPRMATPDRLVERLAELISFDTQNPDGDERPLVQRLAGELRALGASTVDEVEVGDHAYVYARFGGDTPRL